MQWRRDWTRDPARLIVDALAAYRLTRLATADHLPPVAHARQRLTAWTDARAPEYAMIWTCPHCLGWWISAAVVAGRALAERAGRGRGFTLAALPWAVSAVVGLAADYAEV